MKDAALPADVFCCHPFRATTATSLPKQKVPREQVQYLLGHADLDLMDRGRMIRECEESPQR